LNFLASRIDLSFLPFYGKKSITPKLKTNKSGSAIDFRGSVKTHKLKTQKPMLKENPKRNQLKENDKCKEIGF
jgi:hypothetical protein